MMLFHPSVPSVEHGKPQIISLSAVKPPVVCAADNLRFAFGLFKKSRALSVYPAARPICPLPYRSPPPLLRFSRPEGRPRTPALECAPAISPAEQCRFYILHSAPRAPCHAAQQRFVYRATCSFSSAAKMSGNANGVLMLR